MHAAATENTIIPLLRFDENISNGIIYTIKEKNITDVLIGLHQSAGQDDFFGVKAENMLRRIHETIYIYKPMQPLNTLKRIVVVVPPGAEAEPGFLHWCKKLRLIAREAGMPLIIHGQKDTNLQIRNIFERSQSSVKAIFNNFEHWEDFLIFS